MKEEFYLVKTFLTYSFYFLMLLFLTSCYSARSVSTSAIRSERKDSFIYKETIKIDTLTIKSDTIIISNTQLEVRNVCDTLKEDFVKETFKKQGRLSLHLLQSKKGLHLVATCDSVEKILLSKNMELFHYKSEIEKSNNLIKEVQTNWWSWKSFFWGVLAMFLLVEIVDVVRLIVKK